MLPPRRHHHLGHLPSLPARHARAALGTNFGLISNLQDVELMCESPLTFFPHSFPIEQKSALSVQVLWKSMVISTGSNGTTVKSHCITKHATHAQLKVERLYCVKYSSNSQIPARTGACVACAGIQAFSEACSLWAISQPRYTDAARIRRLLENRVCVHEAVQMICNISQEGSFLRAALLKQGFHPLSIAPLVNCQT